MSNGQLEEAAIRFALWKLHPESPERRTAALLLNEELYRKSGKQHYLDRCGELDGVKHAAAVRPILNHVAEVRYTKVSPRTYWRKSIII